MISLIHPSRSRAHKSKATINKWVTEATYGFELIVSVDWNDPELPIYKDLYPGKGVLMVNQNRSAVDAINNAAKVAKGDILIVVSDDTETFEGWDTDLLKEVKGKKDFILKTQDGIQPWIITMPVMDRTYYNRFGYIYHPDYMHMFCDTELTCVADMTGRKITSNLMFPHKHYSVTKERPDAVNIKADATWAQGEKLFLDRYKNKFDLKGPVNQIQDGGMINWLKGKNRFIPGMAR